MNNPNEIEHIVSLLTKYKEAYYNGQPLVSDQEYDKLEDTLRTIEPDHPFFEGVGYDPKEKTKWVKTNHVIPMMSLNKANSSADVKGWFLSSKPKDGLLSWSEKLDGISISLVYDQGKIVSATTRGNGEVGEDILANVVMMRNVPRQLPTSVTGAFRGEIVLLHDDFVKHFPSYSNARNAASGIARVEDREDAKKCQYLDVRIYEAFVRNVTFDNETQKFEYIRTLGFKTPMWGSSLTLDEALAVHDKYAKGYRQEIPYDIDGIVIRHHKQDSYDRAGERNNRPHGAIAFKFKADGTTTTLRDIVWQVGNTGRLTPVAQFDPVELAGATISKATLYNFSYVKALGLTKDCIIEVERANDVIPKITKKVNCFNKETFGAPTSCPSCNIDVVQEGEYIQCNNPSCSSKVEGNVKAWLDSLDILEWGTFVVSEIVKQGLINDIADLYNLTVGDLCDLTNEGGARLGEKTAQTLLDTLHAKKQVSLDQFLGGLNILLFRDKGVRKLMKGGLDTLDKIKTASLSDMESVEGIGDIKAKSFLKGLRDNESLIEKLLQHVSITDNKGSLTSMSFCVTGSLSHPRKVIEKMIKDAGGEMKSSVTKDLTYLVTNDPESSSSKNKKADSLRIPKITEEQLLQLINS